MVSEGHPFANSPRAPFRAGDPRRPDTSAGKDHAQPALSSVCLGWDTSWERKGLEMLNLQEPTEPHPLS
jgi:hypothetical protein